MARIKREMTKLLNLPGVLVENIQDTEETLIVSVN